MLLVYCLLCQSFWWCSALHLFAVCGRLVRSDRLVTAKRVAEWNQSVRKIEFEKQIKSKSAFISRLLACEVAFYYEQSNRVVEKSSWAKNSKHNKHNKDNCQETRYFKSKLLQSQRDAGRLPVWTFHRTNVGVMRSENQNPIIWVIHRSGKEDFCRRFLETKDTSLDFLLLARVVVGSQHLWWRQRRKRRACGGRWAVESLQSSDLLLWLERVSPHR